MEILTVVNVRDGRVLDEVELTAAGELRYRTGAARSMFEGLRGSDQTLTDAQIFALRTDWTNGYVAIRGHGER